MTDLLFNREVKVEFIDRDNPADVVKIEDPKIPGKEPIKIDFQVEKQLSTEPNRADINFWNLSDDTAAKINFRKPILVFKFGRRVDLSAGYEGRSKKIFSGVVIAAITSREGKLKITRVECRNIFYELMNLSINVTVSKGTPKAQFVIDLIKKIGGNLGSSDPSLGVPSKFEKIIRQRLAGAEFTDATTFSDTAYNIINKINRGLLGTVNIYFDDIGTSFNPVGIPLDEPETVYNQNTGLLGTPKPTDIGADFIVQLDTELKLGSPVRLESDTIKAFANSGKRFNTAGKFVTKRIIHAGTNRADGDFQTRVASVFDRTPIFADLVTGPIIA